MGFINTESILIYDSIDSIHNFYLDEDKVVYVNADAITKRIDSKILEEKVKEMDAFIDEDDAIVLACITDERKLILYEVKEGQSIRNIVGDNLKYGLSNIHAFGSRNNVNIVYTMPDDIDKSTYYIMHSHYRTGEWENTEIVRIMSQGLLNNEIKVIIEDDGAYLAFVEYKENKSYLRVRKYDGISWSNDILNIEKDIEVFWFDFQKSNETFEFTYGFREKEQFVIRYEVYEYKENQIITQHDLSNISNCMHPIFLAYKGEQWVVWVELNSIFSSRILNTGKNIDGPYRWKDSKNSDFMIHKFCYNNNMIKNRMQLKCTKVFSTIKGYSLLGFGNLKGTEAVTIHKKKDNPAGGDEVEEKRIESLETEKSEAKELTLPEKIDILEKRIENIENYLRRRAKRSIFGPKR